MNLQERPLHLLKRTSGISVFEICGAADFTN